MAYTADKPEPPETPDQLRARIPGWGVDLDPRDRPSVPKERFAPEATGAHWLLLIGADRIDVAESRVRALLQGRPDNPVTESGLRAEITAHGGASRRRSSRADVNHQWLDPLVSGAPWITAAGLGAVAVGRWRGRARR